MKKPEAKHHIEALAALLLFAVFALCILAVLTSGTEVYQRLTRRDADSYDARTARAYLSTKLRQGDCLDAVWTEDFGGVEALVLAQDVEGETYLTRLYCVDGYIRELFTPEKAEAEPADGEQILPADSAEFFLEDGLLEVCLQSENAEDCFYLSLRSGGEVAAE